MTKSWYGVYCFLGNIKVKSENNFLSKIRRKEPCIDFSVIELQREELCL